MARLGQMGVIKVKAVIGYQYAGRFSTTEVKL
jgi:hypothetical protein